MKKIIVTGAAGFIGFHLCKKLLNYDNEKCEIIGIDNLNKYYDVNLKRSRIEIINKEFKNSSNIWKFIKLNIEDGYRIDKIFKEFQPNIVIHLAAQAGVRYSITNPKPYITTNLVGFFNILESCKNHKISNLIYASSSSVYGGNSNTPFKETDNTNNPISLYAATKSANELMAQTYSHLYKLPCTGLRFFTVYGPWGRPDMAPMIFSKSILEGKPIKIFNYGKMKRDFTFINDVVEVIIRCCKKPASLRSKNNILENNNIGCNSPHLIFNVGNNNPINLLEFVELLENEYGINAIKELKSIEPGDVKETFADIDKLKSWIDFEPKTSFKEGIRKFADWYKKYY